MFERDNVTAVTVGSSAPSPAPKPDKQAAVRGRFDRFVERTPRFLRPSVTGLRQAPFSHIAAFFILHELTAVVPLLGLAGAFHYWHWLPPYFTDAAWISNGIEKFGRYFRKKGWITEEEENEVESEVKQGNARRVEKERDAASKWLEKKENATRWVVELATAYALVKVLLPVRIFVSVWGAPWFARIAIIPVTRFLGLSL
ncbi:hypothetical protein H2200_010877 [Cladophialophora chaetospira]|uniref:Uncharacterized protein n=1 Tax=Cladophialophora chaetospira TaxID=386627 RepID=A0AA39CDY4_9EURO|nr:hypothetical protein H2200_010877 [Cladophialophora chaetospira]